MRAIVLAAGTGSRLGDITNTRTKGLVSINGKKLIDYLLDFLDLSYFTEVIVVGGFCYHDIKEYLDNKEILNIKTLENKDYIKGNIFTLIRGLEEFSEDSFLITNVDHIYPPKMFQKMKKSLNYITAMCDFDRILHDDDMKVKLRNSDGSIKLIRKDLKEYDCGYIGITYIDASMEGIYRDAIGETLKRFGDKAVVENILQVLADTENMAPKICDLSGFGWYEVDTVDDLIKAEREIPINDNFL